MISDMSAVHLEWPSIFTSTFLDIQADLFLLK